ncbi:MAG: tRNA 2-thiouridine(34) synthase MnmA [Clostridia bacterium]|nr:tRNA 2-thiouridine(34) synthase MnmA [Clostridia bacterium]
MTKEKVLVAMSGGVDSAVAAHRIHAEGRDACGVTMKLLCEAATGCCTEEDIAAARATAAQIGIPYAVRDFSGRFEEKVILPFIADYENGRTPNPCVSCNRYLKFEALFSYADEIGCARVATGHYARLAQGANGRTLLLRAVDETKDQSYMLYALSQAQLARALFPLGDLTKVEVREIARAAGFASAERKESQDICFVKGESYTDFIERYTGKRYPEGDFVTVDGQVLGRHRGIVRYTVGQRKGLGLALPAPLYVVRVDAQNNSVILGENEALYTRRLRAKGVNLIAADRLAGAERLTARVRYHQKDSPATVIQTGADEVEILFDEPQRAVTPGQAVVFYDGDTVVGGGVIETVL